MRLEGDRPGPDQMGPAAKLRSQALTLRAVGLEQGSDAIQVFKNVLQRLDSRSKGGFSVLRNIGISSGKTLNYCFHFGFKLLAFMQYHLRAL